MKTINDILKKYDDEIEKVTELDNSLETKRKLELSSECINSLREEIRKKDFPSHEKEIEFFKYQKPKLQGRFYFYATQLAYYTECPKVGSELQKQYLKKELNDWKIEKKEI